MVGVHSHSRRRRARSGLLAAVVSSVTMLGVGLVTAPAADAGTATRTATTPVARPAPAPAPGAASASITGAAATTSPAPTGPTAPNPSPFPPSTPTNVTATDVRTGSVTLTWTASTPGCCPVTGYDITYYMAFDDVVLSASVGNVTTTTISNYIGPGRQYQFRVSAKDGFGHRSNSSEPVTVVTPVTDTGPDTTPPSAPQNLTMGDVTESTATLSWSPSTDDVGVRGYNIYRFDGWFTSVVIATVTTTTHTIALPSSTPPLRNLYYVRARDAVGNLSIASNTVTAPTVPTPPTPPPSTCRVTYQNQSEWQDGFVAAVTIQNTGAAPIDGWVLTFSFRGDQQVTSAWNATVSQSDTTATARNVDWNRALAANGSATFGIQGRWGVSNAPPTSFALNGVPCVTA